MCGIVGYLGKKRDCKFVIDKLKNLEYRGYDSSGVASCENGELKCFKSVGNISNLDKLVPNDLQVTCAIAHTRWATHGKPSTVNSHPHLSQNKTWAVVHNGIIENYDKLKKELNHPCESDTDTTVFVQLLEEREVSSIESFIDVFNDVDGSYAIVAINKNNPDELFLARNRSPLFVAENDGDVLVASDPICFAGFAKKYYSLNSYEFARVAQGEVQFFDISHNPINKELLQIDECFEETDKKEFAHFMLKEIMEQPEALKRQIKTYRESEILKKFDKDFISKFDYVELIGCGTAYHAAMVGAKYFRKMVGIRASAEIANEFIYNEPMFANERTLFIFVSQSGETADTLMALNLAKERGATCIALTNVLYSSLAKQADIVLPVCAGPEIAVASTKAYVCQLSALYMFTRNLQNKIIGDHIDFYEDVNDVADKILKFDHQMIEEFAKDIKDELNPIFIGKDLDYVAACEASLKLKEVSYVNATNYPSGELKHGFLALIENGTPIIVFACSDKTNKKTLNAANEAVSRGAHQITITNDPTIHLENTVFIDENTEYLMPMLEIAPMQYLAYHVSVLKGINPDQPRNLAKSVTVE